MTGPEGNHGEDAKEYWWYLDATAQPRLEPRGATTTRRRQFPYADLVAENAARGKHDPEYELLDTGVFDEDRYWRSSRSTYAKAGPTDICCASSVTQRRAGHRRRCTSCPPRGSATPGRGGSGDARPEMHLETVHGDASLTEHPGLGAYRAGRRGRAQTGSRPSLLFCDNETNAARLFGADDGPAYPKDGINDHVVGGGRHGQPRRDRHEGRVLVPARRFAAGGKPSRSDCACGHRGG